MAKFYKFYHACNLRQDAIRWVVRGLFLPNNFGLLSSKQANFLCLHSVTDVEVLIKLTQYSTTLKTH
jgi:hypothetical protein